MPDSAQEKTEQPTPRRLQRARREGNVARSADFNSAMLLLAGLGALLIFGRGMVEGMIWAFRAVYFELPNISLNEQNICGYFWLGGAFLLKMLLPFVTALAVVGLASNLVQTGWLWATKPLTPQPGRLEPTQGLKRIFSVRSFAELVKGVIKVIIIGWVGYLVVKSDILDFVPLVDESVAGILSGIGMAAFKLALWVTLAILVLGLFDWRFQKWQYIRQLKMTRQEVKDEFKQTEGDPTMRSRIRKEQLRASLNRMIKKLPESDVVVTNPVHVAVALQYDPDTMSAPKVTAKGARKLAEKIKAIAREHDIPIVEEPELARALYRTVEVGWEIPYELYQAVAEVLAMVYRLKEAV